MRYKIIWSTILVSAICLIMALTFQNPMHTTWLSESVRIKAVGVAKNLFGVEDVDGLWWNNQHFFRTLAHIPEYFLLGIAVYGFCGNLMSDGFLRLKSLLVCLSISLLDEVVKWMLPTREFDVIDMLFDFAGYFSGILLISLILSFISTKVG